MCTNECMRSRVAKLYGFACLLVCFVLPVCAQEKDSLTIKQLKEIAVKGLRPAQEIIPAQTLEGKELERLNSHSVADAVRFFSGVQIKDYGGIGGLKTVDVRSMGTNHLGVFYDGIQLGNAQNGQIDLGKFSLDNMEQIALYNGQKSTIFQPAKDYGSAGSIYLTSLKPRFTEGEHTHLRATFKTGSFGLINPSLLWQQKVNRRINSTISAEWTQAHGRYKFRYKKKNGYDTTAIRKNGDVNAFRLEGGLNGIIDKGEWSAKVYYYNAERGLPGFVVKGVFGHIDRQWDENLFIQSSFRKDVSKKYSLLLNAKYADDYTRYIAPDTAALQVDNHYRQKEFYFSAANQYALTAFWDISLSGDFQWNKLDADLPEFQYPVRYTTLVAAASAIHFSRFKAQASVLATIVNETVKVKYVAPPRQEFTPAVFISWQPFLSPAFNIRAFYKRIFRMPTFNDLYYTDLGNSNLQPEFATQYNLGATYTRVFEHKALQHINLETDVYYNAITEKIVAMPAASQFRWTMMNLGFVQIRGIDVKAQAAWQWQNKVRLNTRLSYTYQKAQDFTDPEDFYYRHQIVYIPWHSGSLAANTSYKNWDLNYSLLYNGERYNGKANIPENHLQPWYTSDISVARSLQFKQVGCKITAQVNNVFNQYYDVVLSYPMPGRNYKFTLAVNI